VAPVPARQPGVPLPGAERGAATRRDLALSGRRGQLALAGLLVVAVGALVVHFDVPPRTDALKPIPDALRVLGAFVVLFGVTGFGVTHLLLPDRLRRYELLWVLPAGACSTGLTMTVLGFAHVPYAVNLPLTALAGLALSVAAVRHRGWPEREDARRLAWPAFLAVLVLVTALIPMISIQHFAGPVGEGSDAHVATGAANFLQHAYPTSVDVHQPINQMPQTWRSKFPIYYAYAGVATISGLATWQAMAAIAASLLALAAIGLFLVAFEVFGAPAGIALAAMGLAGLDRMALHTVIHPYFNQTWGFFALPFTLALGWAAVQPGLSRRARSAAWALLAIFALVLVLAYPLAAPIPAVPLLVFILSAWRRRVRAGERVRIRDLYRGWRSLLWIVPLAVLLAFPAVGVYQKVDGAITVLSPGHSLASWGGDLQSYIPFDQFFSLPHGPEGAILFALVAALTVLGLRGRDRAIQFGLGGLLVVGIAVAVYLRHRAFGYYFHFKLLAFIGPLVVLIAAIGAGRLRRAGIVALAILAAATFYSDEQEIRHNGLQVMPEMLALSGWAQSLPPHATVRLDMPGNVQIWVAYFMDSRPLCSQTPLLGTDYSHVPISRKADFILAAIAGGHPHDATGPPITGNGMFALWREKPSVPGPNRCSFRRQSRIYTGLGYFPY
jgi:hypothetical protein